MIKLARNALLLAVSALSVVGAPVTYTLSGVTFGDGGTASGSFAFDPVTLAYSSINITTTSGSTLTGTTYNFYNFLGSGNANLVVVTGFG